MQQAAAAGGAGLDYVSYSLALEELARASAVVAVIVSVNNSLVCWGLEKFGTEEQKQKYLKKLATGESIGAFCLSEPEAGADAAADGGSVVPALRRPSRDAAGDIPVRRIPEAVHRDP